MQLPPVFHIKQGDRLPPLRARTVLNATGQPQDLTGATVRVHMRRKTDNVVVIDAAAALDPDSGLGWMIYNWGSGETDTPGDYDAEFEATLGGRPLTTPNDSHFLVRITEQLA